MGDKAGFRVLEHTADVGLEVEAADLSQLFAVAALGMTSLIVDPQEIEQRVSLAVALEAKTLADLLFDWLNELVYLFDARGLIFSRFDLEVVEDGRLRAGLFGEPLDEDRHRPALQIKACTYHELSVERHDHGWLARVIFDV